MLDEPFRRDPGHRRVCIVDTPLAVEAQRKRQGFGDFIDGGFAQVGFIVHTANVFAE